MDRSGSPRLYIESRDPCQIRRAGGSARASTRAALFDATPRRKTVTACARRGSQGCSEKKGHVPGIALPPAQSASRSGESNDRCRAHDPGDLLAPADHWRGLHRSRWRLHPEAKELDRPSETAPRRTRRRRLRHHQRAPQSRITTTVTSGSARTGPAAPAPPRSRTRSDKGFHLRSTRSGFWHK